MKPEDELAIKRHVAGATVTHTCPFHAIELPQVYDLLTLEECEKWVSPFYLSGFAKGDAKFMTALRGIYSAITPEIVTRLLSDFNWRPRKTGAYFAALKRLDGLEDHIGKLLLRSDVCFAGKMYCVALAEFNHPAGLDYLSRYLDYYLTRPELEYDQRDAAAAIAYLDEKNNTNVLNAFRSRLEAWPRFDWEFFEQTKERFYSQMQSLQECRDALESN